MPCGSSTTHRPSAHTCQNLSPVWYQCSVTLGSRSKNMFDMQKMSWNINDNGEIEVLVPRGKGPRSIALESECRVHATYSHK